MLKKLIRSLILSISVFMTTILIFFVGYKIAYKKSINRMYEAFSPAEQLTSAKTEEPLSDREIISPDYFIARYDGRSLSVYSVSDGKEEFLYTLNVRIEDISQEELYELKNGITLPTKQALASFEEDFTS